MKLILYEYYKHQLVSIVKMKTPKTINLRSLVVSGIFLKCSLKNGKNDEVSN